MTRPRAQQINDLNTRSSKHQPPIPAGSVQSIQNLDLGPNDFYNQFTNATVTQIPGGVEESVSAFLLGTGVEPFIGISVGNQFSITLPGVNAGAPITVTFQAGDFVTLNASSVLTVSFVATRINATLSGFGVSVAVASNNAGFLQLQSADTVGFTVGDQASVTITDITAGMIQKLGFGAVSSVNSVGISSPQRGIITQSADNRGGYFPLRYLDGGNTVLTQASKMLSLGNRRYLPDVSGGSAIYGRLQQIPGPAVTGETWKLSYFTLCDLRASAITSLSRFTTLGAGDVLRINVVYLDPSFGVFNVNVDVDFGAGPAPTNTQDVINKINQQWHTTTDGSNTGAGRAVVTSSISEPYNPQDNLTSGNFYLVLNGNAPIPIIFSQQTSAEDVATVINAAIAAAAQAAQGSAAAVTINGVKFLEIRSSSIDGTVSSVELRPGDNIVTGDYITTLERFGLQVGVYHGSVIASLSGGAEIIISSPFRNGNISGIGLANQSGTPLAKMGLTGGLFSSSFGEESVTPPTISSTPVTILIPEMMEFGEVPDNLDTTVHKFNSQNDPIPASPLAGIKNINKFPGLDSSGHILPSFIQNILDLVTAASIQVGANIGSSTASLVARIVAPYRSNSSDYTLMWESISGPAPAVPTSGAFRVYAVGNERWLITYNAKWIGSPTNAWQKDVTGKLSTKFEYSSSTFAYFWKQVGAGTWTDSGWNEASLFLTSASPPAGLGWQLELGADTALSSSSGPLKLTDPNIQTGSVTFLPMTSNVAGSGDAALRVLDFPATASETPSIIKKLNAGWTVTVGDGIISFGDFNGVSAIDDAVAYWTAHSSANDIRILVKAGSYIINNIFGPTGISIPDGKGIFIEGVHRDSCILAVPDPSTFIHVGTGVSPATLWLKNLTLYKTSAPFTKISVEAGSSIVAEDIIFINVTLQLNDASSYNLVRCTFNNAHASADRASITLTMGNGSINGPFKSLDCIFNAGQNHPALLVKASGPAVPLTQVSLIEYDRCSINLLSTTNVASKLNGNCGVIDVDPNGSNATTLTGVAVTRLVYNNCQVSANTSGSVISILIHLQPQTNGSAAGTGYLAVHRLEISGGKWFAAPTATIFSPFMIADVGGADLVSPGSYGSGKSGVFIRGVTLGFERAGTGFNMGTCTAESYQWFSGSAGDTVTQSQWGAFAINSHNIELSDIQMNNMSQGGGCGDWLIRWQVLHINNINITNYTLGGVAGAPEDRFRFRPRMSGSTSLADMTKVRGITMIGSTATASDWAILGIIGLEPWVSSATIPVTGETFDLLDCTVKSFRLVTLAPSAASGIYIHPVTVGSLYTNSPKNTANLTVKGCYVDAVTIGFLYFSNSGTQLCSRFHILNNRFLSCSSQGILVVATTGSVWDELAIDGNEIHTCGSNGVPGIFVGMDAATYRETMIRNNNCSQNNTASNDVQIRVEVIVTAFSIASDTPRGVIIGNDCNYTGNLGQIQINALNAGANTEVAVVDDASVGGTPIRGMETAYNGAIAGKRFFTDGDGILHNSAVLKTP